MANNWHSTWWSQLINEDIMNTIKFKVKEYDEDTNSIIVSFSSDETKTNNPEDYEAFAIQPIEQYPDITDVEVLKKRIAEQGIGLAEQVKLSEQAQANTDMQAKLKAMVGQTFEYNVSDLINTDTEVTFASEVIAPPMAE